jgi:hypothetical protein
MADFSKAPQPCTVEELLRQVADISPAATSFDLWFPSYLTMGGVPIKQRDAFAVIMKRIREVSEEFVPVGFSGIPGGEMHHFEKWIEDEMDNPSESGSV